MESHRTHHRPGYRCRHGHTSANRPEPSRTPNTYLREDHVLPHLPALHLRLTGHTNPPRAACAGTDTVPPTPAQAIAYLPSQDILLSYSPATRTLTTDTPQAERIVIS